MTSQPTNESELQLYRVLQRANLLSYYDTFICQGGDDVQQLCEAGEEEFLEIMALVGMASKPLHVRRLQKALQEWVSNPGMFQAPLMPPFPTNVGPATGAGGPLPPPLPPPPSSMSQIVPGPPGLVGLGPSRRSPVNLSSQTSPVAMRPSPPSVGGFPLHPSSSTAAAAAAAAVAAAVTSLNSTHCTPSPTSAKDHLMSPTHSSVLNHSHNNGQPNNMGTLGPSANNGCTNLGSSSSSNMNCNTNTGNNSLNNINSVTNSNGSCSGGSSASGLGLITNEYGQPASPVSLTPILMENQIQRLAEAAEMLVKSLMPMDPKFASNKKRISKELEYVMNMPEDDPRRLDEIRKYAAIYGRFDCKRKPEKPLTLHEVSVNEAAAQICKHIPALLTRRDELFPLARQVVRDSGYQYSKGHSRSQIYQRQYDGTNAGSGSEGDPSNPNGNSHNKRIRIGDNQLDFGKMNKYHNGMARGYNRIPSLCDDKGDTDDNDSQFSLYSNTSSPSISQDQRGDSPTKESSQNSSDFSKLIPAKKTNNTSAATQLTRQLVQETLTEEGLRMVNEYMNQNKHEDIGVDLRVAVSEKISEPSLMPPTSLPATTGFSGCMP